MDALAGWQNIPNPGQRKVFADQMGHPVLACELVKPNLDLCLATFFASSCQTKIDYVFVSLLSDLDCDDGLRVLPGLLLYDQPQLRGRVRPEGHHEAEQQGLRAE